MCTLAIAWHSISEYPFIFVANRDEFRSRPTTPMHWWPSESDSGASVLGGRDLEAGGTWTAVTRNGKFAAVTNYRDPSRKRSNPPSRGAIPTAFFTASQKPITYLESLDASSKEYLGFNVLTAELGSPNPTLAYFSNYANSAQTLPPGIYGLSNALLDSPWPKLLKAKSMLAKTLEKWNDYKGHATELADVLTEGFSDTEIAPDVHLPKTGVPIELERSLSALCIDLPDYGTRVTTVIILNRNGTLYMRETPRGTDANGRSTVEVSFPLST